VIILHIKNSEGILNEVLEVKGLRQNLKYQRHNQFTHEKSPILKP